MLFIVAYRADDAASSRDGKGHPLLHVRNELGRYSLYTDVVVPRMTAKDLDGLLRARYSRYQGSSEFERWLAERSGGNALFITQYLSTLEEDGIVSPQTGEFKGRFDSVRVPTSAFSVVEERIRRLDDDSRELLRYASVEGATFTVSVLSAIADVPRLKLLQKLRLISEKHGVIKSLGKQRIYASESTAYQFTNVLMQRAMYEGLEDEERDELHEGIFRSIKADFAEASDTDSSIVGLAVRLAAHAATPADRLFSTKLLLDAARVSWRRFAEEGDPERPLHVDESRRRSRSGAHRLRQAGRARSANAGGRSAHGEGARAQVSRSPFAGARRVPRGTGSLRDASREARRGRSMPWSAWPSRSKTHAITPRREEQSREALGARRGARGCAGQGARC